MKTLRLILGDQLSHTISSVEDIDAAQDTILICEVMEEANYVPHHKKKIAFLFSAMRHFAEELKIKGIHVRYVTLDDPDNAGSFFGEIDRAVKDLQPDRIIVTEPGEYRVLADIKKWSKQLNLPVEILEDKRFLCSHKEFQEWAKDRKSPRMEFFYREMRRKYRTLMEEGDKPIGGAWNYDSENRKPPKEGLKVPPPFMSEPDETTKEVIALVAEKFSDNFGDLEPFHFAVTRTQALKVLEHFISVRLKNFGDYQDAMITSEPWMYHSHISFYMNCGLLSPLECIEAAEIAYHNGDAPLNAVEGFIRQIMGWREYVRGIYWLKMPEYETENFLKAKRELPPLYWGAPTKMNCMKQCVKETKENAYAHHIQRLMVLGNFALLAGLDPKEVNDWYLLVYADAYQWVELPNVSGMILFADGGYLGSKPYAASGAYINKMSDYCKGCSYSPTVKNGPKACPFNYLYWDFLNRHYDKLKGNQRLAMIYKTLERMDGEKLNAISSDSERFLKAMDRGDCV